MDFQILMIQTKKKCVEMCGVGYRYCLFLSPTLEVILENDFVHSLYRNSRLKLTNNKKDAYKKLIRRTT